MRPNHLELSTYATLFSHPFERDSVLSLSQPDVCRLCPTRILLTCYIPVSPVRTCTSIQLVYLCLSLFQPTKITDSTPTACQWLSKSTHLKFLILQLRSLFLLQVVLRNFLPSWSSTDSCTLDDIAPPTPPLIPCTSCTSHNG